MGNYAEMCVMLVCIQYNYPCNISYHSNSWRLDDLYRRQYRKVSYVSNNIYYSYYRHRNKYCTWEIPENENKLISDIYKYYLDAYRLSELNFFLILKVANIWCFILIAVEIFHNIILK
jgi:hypothetical protein